VTLGACVKKRTIDKAQLMQSILRVVQTGAATLMVAQSVVPAVAMSPAVQAQKKVDLVMSCLPAVFVIKNEPAPCPSLNSQMAEHHVPGVSVAIIHNGAIEWAGGFGVKELGGDPVMAETLFQAGSISKPVTAMGALHLVQEKRLSLDADVNSELRAWKIRDSAAAHGKPVTLRELLSHTAGLNVTGFAGYAADARVPTLLEILDGRKPANSPAIELQNEPGREWSYSGGGYAVVQQLVIETGREDFVKFMRDTVLVPLGMTFSTFEQPLPANRQRQAAHPYGSDGVAIVEGAHTHPELAAAGLWSTPSDLARFAIEIQRSLQGKANHVLSKELTREMLTRGQGSWGLGLEVGGASSDPFFRHTGQNAGYESYLVAYANRGDGVVVMTNAQGGTQIAAAIVRSVALAYHWPNLRPAIHTLITVDRTVLAHYVGTYDLSGNAIAVVLDGNQLNLQAGGHGEPIYPESPTLFLMKSNGVEIEFLVGDQGQATRLVVHEDGAAREAPRK
jgi:CubicO group peptidase (beta-lactamase class C family)